MVNLREVLLQHLHPDLAAIFWISSQPFNEALDHFIILDDLMDGLLAQTIQSFPTQREEPSVRIQLLANPYFGQTLYLAHLHFQHNFIKSDLESLFQMLEPSIKNQPHPKKIIILYEEDKLKIIRPWLNSFEEKNSQILLEKIAIDQEDLGQ